MNYLRFRFRKLYALYDIFKNYIFSLNENIISYNFIIFIIQII